MVDWPTRSVEKCLSRLRFGSVRKLPTQAYRPTGRYPIIDQGQSLIAGWTDDDGGLIDRDLPVIVFGDHTRAFKFIDFPFVRGADGTQVLKPTGDIDPLFFFYALRGIDLPSRGYNRHFKALKEREIGIPGDAEQVDIARILRLVESALETQPQQVAAWEACKRAAMRALFTKGLRGEAQKETEIGPVPESWELRSVLDLCDIRSGGTPRKSVPEYWIGDIPWVSGKDLKAPTLDDAIDHVSAEGIEAGSRLAPAGTVLVLVRGMGLAKDLPVAVISRPMAFNQDIKALVSRGDFDGKFLRSAIYVHKDRLLTKIVPSAHGTMTLNLNDIETFMVPCPADPVEADEIVAVLDAIDRKIDLHRSKRAALDELFKALLHKLLTGEIRVSDLDLSALSPDPAPADSKTPEVAA
ncbi:restriction endonuclease subunit S [Acuticoccus sp. M5D2P5]|uniref:restriction endonuclease subunit S n=1 Tax=Acuticoccus kalidii TaxID=2910977 RepID=UPI001F20D862|nr:restriction endonuclease subunit S [Acuticoccus kalidii]MCF3935344.1 restriction endonuclease subunit S [Acuticoccus kalidii]